MQSLSIIFFSILFAFNLNAQNKIEKKNIILSKASPNYINWIKNDSIHIIDSYTITNTDSILQLADAIILTGGEDINPLHYNDTLNLKLCEAIDFSRDTMEIKLFDYALQNKIPLIGVCRGMQMINVASGGTLYGDLPTEIGNTVLHRDNGEVMHSISIINQSQYRHYIFPAGKNSFIVNSWHHQGLKDISKNLHIIAVSNDGLPEAVVLDKSIHPFMIGVQFHPERLLEDSEIPHILKKNFFNHIFSD